MPKLNKPAVRRPQMEVYTASHGQSAAYSALPSPVTSLYCIVAAGSVTGLAYLVGDKWFNGQGALFSVIAIAAMTVIGVIAVAIRARRIKRDQSARGEGFESALRGTASGWDTSVSDPAEIARLDDLRNNFQKGIQAFSEYGKDIYSLPWYVIVGEPGSGKTEAIRRSELRFPDNLQDKLQGTGGTYSMNWWFTNNAVILDTAGAMLMQPEAVARFEEFLTLLRTHRPACPINGMILTLPTDSLLADPPPVAEQKARTIAAQLAVIQKVLDVRFPIYLMISKSDRLPGFREFFDAEGQAAFERQMMGWSNPAPLGDAFSAEKIYGAIDTIAWRLQSRALALIADPIPPNPTSRRLDDADAIYSFPQVLRTLSPRLKLYLDVIFQTGTWATKPPFFRGLYFTSALREGAQLDQQLAQALGMPLNQLPPGGFFAREKSVFLRDLFMEKIFPESGLVTRLFDIGAHLRKRLTTFYGATAALLFLALGFAWLVKDKIEDQLHEDQKLWLDANSTWNNGAFLPVFTRSNEHSEEVKDRPSWTWTAENKVKDDVTNLMLLQRIRSRIEDPVHFSWVFRPVPEWRDFLARRRQGYFTLFEGSVMKPVLDAVRERILWDTAPGATTSPETQILMAKAYGQLLLLETWLDSGAKKQPNEKDWVEFFSQVRNYILDPAPPGGWPADKEPPKEVPAVAANEARLRDIAQLASEIYGTQVVLSSRAWMSEGAVENLPAEESSLSKAADFIFGNTLQAAESNDQRKKEIAEAKQEAMARIQQAENALLQMSEDKPNGPRQVVEDKGLRPFKEAVGDYEKLISSEGGAPRTALSMDIVATTAKRIRETSELLRDGGPEGLQRAAAAASKVDGSSSAVQSGNQGDAEWVAAHKRLVQYLENFKVADATQAGLTATGSIGNLSVKLAQAAQKAQELQAPAPVAPPASGEPTPGDVTSAKINAYLKRFRGSPFISLAFVNYIKALQATLEPRLKFPLVNCRAEHLTFRDFEQDCKILAQVEKDATDMQGLSDSIFECDERRDLALIFQRLQDVFDIKNALLSGTMKIQMGAVREPKKEKKPIEPPPVGLSISPAPAAPPLPPEEVLVGFTYIQIYVGKIKILDEPPKGRIEPVDFDGFSQVRIILTFSSSGKPDMPIPYNSPPGNWGLLRDLAKGKETFTVTNGVNFSIISKPTLPSARWPERAGLNLGLSAEPKS